jgi:hypothetical protein
VCSASQECSAQGKCVCDATSCPDGCCDANGTCNTSGNATCGVHGAACAACGSAPYPTGSTCSAGACSCPGPTQNCSSACVDVTSSAANCGSCGHACSGGAACSGGLCQPTVYAQAGAGAPGTPAESVNGLATDGSTVYWTYTRGPGGTTQIMGVAGGGTNLTNGTGNYYGPLTLIAGSLYWIAAGKSGPFAESMPTSGGAPSGLKLGGMVGIAADGTSYYLTTGSSILICAVHTATCQTYVASNTGTSMAVAGSFLYWTDPGSSAVKRCALGGTCAAPTTVYSPTTSPAGLAVDSTNVYWLDGSGLQQVSINGGTAKTLAPGANGVGPAANDGAGVYWAGQNSVYRASVGVASSQTTIATQQLGVTNIIVDAAAIYWNDSTGAILRLGK